MGCHSRGFVKGTNEVKRAQPCEGGEFSDGNALGEVGVHVVEHVLEPALFFAAELLKELENGFRDE